MIKLSKHSEPGYLCRNKHKPTCKYNNRNVKEALIFESNNKCMYCEVKFVATSGQIEHIKPYEKFPDEILVWENLGLACEQCNRAKSAKYEPELKFINPYVDDPPKFFWFAGPVLYEQMSEKRAEYTIRELELNRMTLIQDRFERLEDIHNIARRIDECTDGTLKESIKNSLKKECSVDKAYSMCVSTFISALGL